MELLFLHGKHDIFFYFFHQENKISNLKLYMNNCTAIHMESADGSHIYGRTLEFSLPVRSSVLVIPRGIEFVGTCHDGKSGKQWRSLYGFMGMSQRIVPSLKTNLVDGINEKGLVVSALYLPQYSKYQPYRENARAESLASWEVVNLLLGLCANITDVKRILGRVRVVQQSLPSHAQTSANGILPTIHFNVLDRKGSNIVVEYLEGNCVITDNHVHVLTNAPPFSWQLQNLERYSSLRPRNATSIANVNAVARAIYPNNYPFMAGNGNGMMGLPGDFTPPSRFVRAALFRRFATIPKTGEATENLMWHMMNHFDIFQGLILDPITTTLETTQWTVVYNLTTGSMSIRTYHNLIPQIFFLSHLEKDIAGKKIREFPL